MIAPRPSHEPRASGRRVRSSLRNALVAGAALALAAAGTLTALTGTASAASTLAAAPSARPPPTGP